MKSEFEWLTSNTRIAYPFVDRVTDPTAPDGTKFSDLVVDAYLAVPEAVEKDVRLYRLTDPGVAAEVEFRYRDGSVAFLGLVAACRRANFGPWTFLEWVNSAGAARLLLKTAEIAGFTWPASPVAAWLVPFVVQPIQPFVRSITAESQTYQGTVELIAGYNLQLGPATKITGSEESVRQINKVGLGVVAGAGLGRYPICEFGDTPPIYTINGVGADEQGNFKLDALDCYKVEVPVDNPLDPPPHTITPNTIKMSNDCSPCCDCADYVYVYDILLRRVRDYAKQVSTLFYATRDKYAEFVQKFLQQKSCREVPQAFVKVVARQGWTAAVQIIVQNNKACTANSVNLNIAVDSLPAKLIDRSVFVDTDQINHKPSSLSGGWPSYQFSFTDGILGSRYLMLTFELYFCIAEHDPDALVTVTVTGTVDGAAVSSKDTSKMPPPFNKSDPCSEGSSQSSLG